MRAVVRVMERDYSLVSARADCTRDGYQRDGQYTHSGVGAHVQRMWRMGSERVRDARA
jgi:hypothetical protein